MKRSEAGGGGAGGRLGVGLRAPVHSATSELGRLRTDPLLPPHPPLPQKRVTYADHVNGPLELRP